MIFKMFQVPSEVEEDIFSEIERITQIVLEKMLHDFNNRAKEDLIFSQKEYFSVYKLFLNSTLSINEILELPEFVSHKQQLEALEHKNIQELSRFLHQELDYILESQVYGYFEQVINDLVSESHYLFSPYLMAMHHPFSFAQFNEIYKKNHKKKQEFDLKTHVLDYNRFILSNYVLKNIKKRYFTEETYKNWLI